MGGSFWTKYYFSNLDLFLWPTLKIHLQNLASPNGGERKQSLASIFLAAINFVPLILLTLKWHIWHSLDLSQDFYPTESKSTYIQNTAMDNVVQHYAIKLFTKSMWSIIWMSRTSCNVYSQKLFFFVTAAKCIYVPSLFRSWSTTIYIFFTNRLKLKHVSSFS